MRKNCLQVLVGFLLLSAIITGCKPTEAKARNWNIVSMKND